VGALPSPVFRCFAEKYDVVAVVPAGTTRHSVNLMLQRLLAERFKLVLHHDKRDFAVYALVAAKTGPKLTPSNSDTVAPATNHLPQMPQPMLDSNRGLWIMTVAEKSMQQLADELSRRLDRPVFDMTELAGAFDFTLTWAASGRIRTREGEYTPVGDGTGLTLNEAVERQLGLKLDPRKTALDVLVIGSTLKVPIEN
jgi:uncharacterized protein (TIGR03435 family)